MIMQRRPLRITLNPLGMKVSGFSASKQGGLIHDTGWVISLTIGNFGKCSKALHFHFYSIVVVVEEIINASM